MRHRLRLLISIFILNIDGDTALGYSLLSLRHITPHASWAIAKGRAPPLALSVYALDEVAFELTYQMNAITLSA